MKYWVLAISLLALGCSGGNSGDADEPASVGAEIAEDLKDAQDAAANVETLLEDSKRDIDAAVDASEETDED